MPLLKLFSILLFAITLINCGGGGENISQNPAAPTTEQGYTYVGPTPQTADVQKFKNALWDNIAITSRCAGCHTKGNQAPYFADQTDVNTAYAAATGLVNLSNPNLSRLVEKVANGHNCWSESDIACGETMTQWIKAWADNRVTQANTVQLVAPVIKEPGNSKSLPADSALFSQHVHPLLTQYCAGCHSNEASVPQSPFFASSDSAIAYQSAQAVIDIENPNLSRLIVRLRNQFHNCWSSCNNNAIEMQNAIEALSDSVEAVSVDEDLVISKALRLTDGVVAASGGRHESHLIALYQFKTGEGAIAYDTSGVEPAANLNISGDVEWLGSWGIQIKSGKAQASTVNSEKIHHLINSTGEFSIEAWLAPANVSQEGPARIVTYSAGNDVRNFTLGQTLYNYDFLLRNQSADFNGMPMLSTPDADEVLQATLQHVVINFDPIKGRRIYVNGVDTGVRDELPAALNAWDDSYALIVGNEASNQYQWQGSMRLLAIHNLALDEAQIQQNYDAGVGEKFFLLFSISEQINQEDTYVVFEVSQFDNYSYLFSQPFLINLQQANLSQTLTLAGMHIGINGQEAKIGQAYANLNSQILTEEDISQPYQISPLGTLIAIEKGADQDEFFLSFEQLGQHENIKIAAQFSIQQPTATMEVQADIGLKNFAEINASMSELTGIAQSQTKVSSVFQRVKRQLPSNENIETFISAQQMAITQLAIAYCDLAIEDNNIRSDWFTDVDFSTNPEQAYSNKNLFIAPLLERLLPKELASQPDIADVELELSSLIDTLASCASTGAACNATRTMTIAKASCTAVLASATNLLQ